MATFTDAEKARQSLDSQSFPVAIRVTLKNGGKGARVLQNVSEADEAIEELTQGKFGNIAEISIEPN